MGKIYREHQKVIHIVYTVVSCDDHVISLCLPCSEVREELGKLSQEGKIVSGKRHHQRLQFLLSGQRRQTINRELHLRSGVANSVLPDSIYSELQQLIECHQVSGVLGSAVRRQALEITLAESLQRHARQHRPAPRQRHSQANTRNTRSGRSSQYPVPRRDQSQILRRLRESPSLRRLDPEQRDAILSDVSNLVNRRLVSDALSGDFRAHLEVHIQERADRLNSGLGHEDLLRRRQRTSGRRNTAHTHRHTHYPVPRRDQSQIVRILQNSPSLNRLDPEQRASIMSEVSGLVQRGLVTNALSGDFRGVLEVHIQERADRLSHGVTSEEVLRSLERRRERRHQVHPEPSPSSAGQHVSGEAVQAMEQELRDLRSKVNDLHRLMQTSFDLQLDIQRSIRQEVSAAMHAALNVYRFQHTLPQQRQPSIFTAAEQTASNLQQEPTMAPPVTVGPHPSPPLRPRNATHVVRPSPIVSPGHCVICLSAEVDCALYRCGHMCVDMHCALELKAQSLKCPICRAPIADIVRTYNSW